MQYARVDSVVESAHPHRPCTRLMVFLPSSSSAPSHPISLFASSATMDEHIGVTRRVACSMLAQKQPQRNNKCSNNSNSGGGFTRLLQSSVTQAGASQRLHNILVLYPSLLSTVSHQRQVFECGETMVRVLGSMDGDNSGTPINRSYLLVTLNHILSLRSYFTPKQQERMNTWTSMIAISSAGASSSMTTSDDDPETLLSRLRSSYLSVNPFESMQIASFRIPGVKQADLQPQSKSNGKSNAKKKVTTISNQQATSSAPDLPFSHLPRTPCPQCARVQSFYCSHCYCVVHPLAMDKLPRVTLPISIDILLHSSVLQHKSTALQSLLLVHPPSMIRVFTYPKEVPKYDVNETAVVFPKEGAWTIGQLAKEMQRRSEVASSTASTSSQAQSFNSSSSTAASSSPSSKLPLAFTLRRLVLIEGTWSEATQMVQHPALRDLVHVRLDMKDGDEEEKQANDSASTTSPAISSSVSSPRTAFWRYQRFGAGFLSTIEAMYHLILQYHPYRRVLTPTNETNDNTPATASSDNDDPHQYDNLLWIFAMSYERVRDYYRTNAKLLPPLMHQQEEEDEEDAGDDKTATTSPPSSSSSSSSSDAWSTPSLACLREFFTRRSLTLPHLRFLSSSSELPAPYDALLASQENTTFALSEYWKQPVQLNVIEKEEKMEEGVLQRWIKLEVKDMKENAAPSSSSSPSPSPHRVAVEFSAIRIFVSHLPSTIHPTIWSGQVPFARALREHQPEIKQKCYPKAWFEMEWSEELSKQTGIEVKNAASTTRHIVYGRCNELRSIPTINDDVAVVLCEVVEIIPNIQE